MITKLASLLDGLFDRKVTVSTITTRRQYYPDRPHVTKSSNKMTDTNPAHVDDSTLSVPFGL